MKTQHYNVAFSASIVCSLRFAGMISPLMVSKFLIFSLLRSVAFLRLKSAKATDMTLAKHKLSLFLIVMILLFFDILCFVGLVDTPGRICRTNLNIERRI